MDLALCLDCPLVAITPWISQGPAVIRQAHIVDCPTINADGSYAFSCRFGAVAKTLTYSLNNSFDIPKQGLLAS